jgi:hypothetical protein
VRKVDIIPVLQRKVCRLKDQPDEDGPGNHQEEFLCPVDDEGVAFQTIDDCIDCEDVGPPGKTVKPAIERLDLSEMEYLRENQKEKTNDTMKREPVLHQKKLAYSITKDNF